ncbi:hypothetical protein C8R46DRAFT_1114054, partial [Mycena filopes]
MRFGHTLGQFPLDHQLPLFHTLFSAAPNARISTFFCLAIAAVTSVGAAAIPGVPGPSSSLITFCTSGTLLLLSAAHSSTRYSHARVHHIHRPEHGMHRHYGAVHQLILQRQGIAGSEENCAGSVGLILHPSCSDFEFTIHRSPQISQASFHTDSTIRRVAFLRFIPASVANLGCR